MFILFLPVMLMAFALIIDVGLMYGGKIKGEALLKEAEKENLDIEEYFKLNDLEITKLRKTNNGKKECVIINYNIDSIFGSLVGYKNYDIKIDNC